MDFTLIHTKYPVIQGHEISGIIVEIGCQVKCFSLREKVTIIPQMICSKCYLCRHGSYHICDSLKVMGFQVDGAAQEYFCVPESNVIKLPDSLSFEAGAMIEPVSVAVHALSRAGDVDGKRILILGAGPIGNLVG
jgi:L-iditol 2-dehydrogenase